MAGASERLVVAAERSRTMARFKRRKPRVLWLPVHGRDFSDSMEGSQYANGIGGALSVAGNGRMFSDIQPVTFDYSDSASAEEGTEVRSLQDLTQGNAYRLRRIVGKFHAGCTLASDAPTGSVAPLDVAAGFMVCRTDPDGTILAGQSAGISGDVNRGPLAQDGAEDPWIWRRRWLLSPIPKILQFPVSTGVLADAADLTDIFNNQAQWPQTTAEYGSVQDGPHIDQKTARVISSEERLFFWVQGRTIGEPVNELVINWQLDVRLLASLRTNIGNRRNATR